MLQFAGDNADQFTTEYGRISRGQRSGPSSGRSSTSRSQGGDKLFGEPALNLDDFIQTDGQGRGMINILAADKLMLSPKMYATFLLWMLSELFERMPEVGDLDKPKLVFFFDEAHLLFTDAPDALLQKIEQIVRLIRSKGVGVFFVTQNPLDIPDTVLGQLGNRIQHALRAFTPRDQKAVRAAADDAPGQSQDRRRKGHRRAGGRRGARLVPGREGPARHRRAGVRPAAPEPDRPDRARHPASKSSSGSVIYGHYEKVVDRESALRDAESGGPRTAARAPKPAQPIRVHPAAGVQELPLPRSRARRGPVGRPPRHAVRSHGQKRRAVDREPGRPPDHARHHGLDPRREEAANASRSLLLRAGTLFLAFYYPEG